MHFRFTGLIAIIVLAGCQNSNLAAKAGKDPGPAPSNASAVELLKWSMAKHKALTSLSTSAEVQMSFDGSPSLTNQKRQISYLSSGPFKVVSENFGFKLTSVSDGKTLVEYSNAPDARPTKTSAPSSISEAESMQMKHHMFCGSMLNEFFGGQGNYSALVSDRKPVEFGSPLDLPGGVKAKVVTFFAKGSYGNTSIAIDEKTGLVHRIEYDSMGLIEKIKSMDLGRLQKEAGVDLPQGLQDIQAYPTVETYSNHRVNLPIPSSTFDTTLPDGSEATLVPSPESADEPPVKLGAPAPDAEFVDLSGKPLKLSSLRGRVVLIDFWATWCGPCRIGLPKTQELHDKYKDKGLAVLTVSDEDAATVKAFIKAEKYTFPAYRDPDGKANEAYKISAIPTLAILDAKGNLSAFLVGLQDEETVKQELKKAGLKL